MNGNGASAIMAILGDMPLGEIKEAVEFWQKYQLKNQEAQKAFLVYAALKDAYVDIEKLIWMPEIADEIKKLIDEYRVGGG